MWQWSLPRRPTKCTIHSIRRSWKPPAVAQLWEGRHRPDHFQGVATVVLKLLNTIPADRAYFGQKDFQQVAVIRAMVRDLDVPVEIATCPTVREEDGLAMSSRNRYLSETERQTALSIQQSLQQTAQDVAAGKLDVEPLVTAMRKTMETAGVDKIDYVAIVDPNTLQPLDHIGDAAVALIAAHVGSTRLIDNAILK